MKSCANQQPIVMVINFIIKGPVNAEAKKGPLDDE